MKNNSKINIKNESLFVPMLFTDSILNDRPIKVFNNSEMSRDFTYIDDIAS